MSLPSTPGLPKFVPDWFLPDVALHSSVLGDRSSTKRGNCKDRTGTLRPPKTGTKWRVPPSVQLFVTVEEGRGRTTNRDSVLLPTIRQTSRRCRKRPPVPLTQSFHLRVQDRGETRRRWSPVGERTRVGPPCGMDD